MMSTVNPLFDTSRKNLPVSKYIERIFKKNENPDVSEKVQYKLSISANTIYSLYPPDVNHFVYT